MTAPVSIMDFYYKEELIQLLPEKVAFLPGHQMMVVADLHLGKASHFRKAGIMIPLPNVSPDLLKMDELIDKLNPSTVVFLGDLFHSSLNKEWEELKDFLRKYPMIRFVLTKGNHDILSPKVMENTSIEVVDELEVGNDLLLTHEPMIDLEEDKLNISGHIHPGVMIKGKGRQLFRLPCFYYHEQSLILPAFGKLTGLYILKEIAGAKIYPVFPDEVLVI
ncbi:putative phosphoesterase [Algoriphagus ratkowskyi]|uniref:Ligase-associated DNA damage response endonuclease PdeM n=1 Tax=Algoriphagus ratkowskyi TaxID=57028 RepID=A0A2W7RLA4_9BACT|nr:ligase-associated DNA damage response endonuclease PdeM [Algoriphagus ratkowskyi]PZX55359.1 putative phosphoesterase [Algoriphagus ratkowskyi]TXD79710.1 ligase-associated DNA damage response endonuclease PdeM [Algoriphagus ratkowskyi]